MPLQGVTAPTHDTQGAASLALGLVLLAFQAVPVQIRNLSSLIFNMRYVMAQESDEVKKETQALMGATRPASGVCVKL